VIPTANHINANVWVGQGSQTSIAVQHGTYLTASDLDRLRMLVQEFCVKALLPHVEKQIQQLSDLVGIIKILLQLLILLIKCRSIVCIEVHSFKGKNDVFVFHICCIVFFVNEMLFQADGFAV
jgi:hypothetical protein